MGIGWGLGQGCVMGTWGYIRDMAIHRGHRCVMGLQTCSGDMDMGWEHRHDRDT